MLLSLGAHVLGMSAITITAQGDAAMARPYTRVDFLGAILRKTAFDIMLENADPAVNTAYRQTVLSPEEGRLEVTAPKMEPAVQELPDHPGNSMDALVMDFLAGAKAVPGPGRGFIAEDRMVRSRYARAQADAKGRKVIYRPEAPFMTRGLYGDREAYKIRVRALIAGDGNVRKVEPVTTTGYPGLDIAALKFVRGWIYEPKEDASAGDEWRETDVVLNAGD